MKTKNFHRDMELEFGKPWSELKATVREAKHPYPAKLSWRCIAKGKARNNRQCILAVGIKEDGNVTGALVAEEFSYVRFAGSETIWRYQNSADTKQELDVFDRLHITEWEDGDTVILEPVGAARSREYSKSRRDAIKLGEHRVRPRGPNTAKRESRHHFRPY
jgi:hypothetical protein